MTGKDIQKVMENASKMFTLFAGILKVNRRPDSKYDSPEKIDELCNSFASIFVLLLHPKSMMFRSKSVL